MRARCRRAEPDGGERRLAQCLREAASRHAADAAPRRGGAATQYENRGHPGGPRRRGAPPLGRIQSSRRAERQRQRDGGARWSLVHQRYRQSRHGERRDGRHPRGPARLAACAALSRRSGARARRAPARRRRRRARVQRQRAGRPHGERADRSGAQALERLAWPAERALAGASHRQNRMLALMLYAVTSPVLSASRLRFITRNFVPMPKKALLSANFKAFFGIGTKFLVMNLNLEADKTGDVTAYSIKASIRF